MICRASEQQAAVAAVIFEKKALSPGTHNKEWYAEEATNDKTQAILEVSAYIKETPISQDSNLLEWWKKSKVQGASFRGWKEMTSLFNKDDEHQLLTASKPTKVKGA
ncbi:Testis development-related protein [Acipenser ruthenus]|uniref:Testis development-related protein n=1 Tax=Acipenser ruthenus TaxID=7906 RepID=A0A444TW21_ACIRT|nr:Testis development-related protein [Acipenser ruthenus]